MGRRDGGKEGGRGGGSGAVWGNAGASPLSFVLFFGLDSLLILAVYVCVCTCVFFSFT